MHVPRSATGINKTAFHLGSKQDSCKDCQRGANLKVSGTAAAASPAASSAAMYASYVVSGVGLNSGEAFSAVLRALRAVSYAASISSIRSSNSSRGRLPVLLRLTAR